MPRRADTGNDVGSVVDMADMRNVTARVGAALVLAAAGVAATHATSSAEPAPGHQVTYTLATGGTYDFTISYLTAQPPSKDAFNTDSNAFMKRETITVSPDAPWVFQTTLETRSGHSCRCPAPRMADRRPPERAL